MNWLADVKLGQRAIPRPSVARATVSALCLIAISSPSLALADTVTATAEAEVAAAFPKRLAITVIGDERALGTFQQRVSSWFSDGTEVVVTISSDVSQKQLLASSPEEVRALVIPLSTGNALLSVSCVTPPAAPRHLVREVALHSGFDELGLERLASVIHSAFVALSQGVEGVEREQAERELGAAGVAVGSFAQPSDATPPAASAPPSPPPPQAPPVVAPAPTSASPSKTAVSAAESRSALIVAAGYGVRLRGAEGAGHGPSLVLGLQLPGARTAFDLQLSAQYLFSSDFEAQPFSASVQTSALRAQIGIEPQLKSSLFAQVLLGLGADIARISAQASSSSGDLLLEPHSSGTQVRSMAEISLGIIQRGEVLDIGLVAQAIFSFQEVQYSAKTGGGDAVLQEPWAIQPALSLQGRFRNAL
ncbi:MAG TPA: hypothetical protein VER96_35865 [Polyangiaceae bacterium]|nr:hypothetical protein [Polyangiaceae bacterium]